MSLKHRPETFLVVQWLELYNTEGGMRSIPAQGTKIPHATTQHKKKKKHRPALETTGQAFSLL